MTPRDSDDSPIQRYTIAMNRIERIFADLRKANRKALMPFVTAGYPSIEATAAILPALQRAGASIVELGFPFSDPIADGPVIAASMTEALNTHVTPGSIFDLVKRLRPTLSIGLVAMVSYTIVDRIGPRKFVELAGDAGLDGFIIPDLPLEESDRIIQITRDAGLICSLLIAPTTPAARAAHIARACTGFVYVMSRTGITGESAQVPADLAPRLAALRQVTDLPIAVGFGIGKPEQVRCVVEHADAAIVGSAIVREITQVKDQSATQIAQHVEAFVKNLATGL
ncbi:MAG: tryptophan synthase subunit alpha [Phycisphaerales bacterium]